MKAQQVWFTKPYTVEIREQTLPPLENGDVLVRSIFSAISAGTEMLVYKGEIPDDIPLDINIESLKDKKTTYPLQYGYATVGRIEQVGSKLDEALLGNLVFAFQPHASLFITKSDQVIALPDDIEPTAAIFLANMETSVNLILDGNPCEGEDVIIMGQGIVGLLLSYLLAQHQIGSLYTLDKFEKRRDYSKKAGVALACNPGSASELDSLMKAIKKNGQSNAGADLVYELTGSPEALNMAIGLCGFNGRVIVGSWYGTKPVKLDLGRAFHRNRIQIISSQVSTIAPHLAGEWDKSRRLQTAWNMIRKVNPQQFINTSISH